MRACLPVLWAMLVLWGSGCAKPAPPGNPWSDARVGDALEYAYAPENLRADVTLETVAIAPPWVWVQVTAKYSEPARPELRFLIPVNRERQLPWQPERPSEPVRKRHVRVGDITVPCEEQGSICETRDPRFYLGPRLPSGFELKLLRVRRGPEATPATVPPPGLPRLYAPDLWYRRLGLKRGTSREVQEVFVRGQLVRQSRVLMPIQRTEQRMRRADVVTAADDWYKTTAWKEELSVPLLSVVLSIVSEDGQPRQTRGVGEFHRGRVRMASGEVEGLIHTGPGFQWEYALDPWAPLFDGLPWSVRQQPLVSIRRYSEGSETEERLWDWGPMLQPAPPAPEGTPPDVLGLKQVMGLVSDKASRSSCLDSLPKGPPGPITYRLRLDLTMRVRPDGGVDSAALRLMDDGRGLTDKHLRCLEAELRTLRLPRHTRQMEPIRVHFSFAH